METPTRRWYYLKNREKIGPIEDIKFRGLFKNEVLSPDTLVWTKGLEKWTLAKLIKNLVPPELIQPLPSPPQPPTKTHKSISLLALVEILTIPILFLNFGGGIIGGIWLAILGKWRLIGIGVFVLVQPEMEFSDLSDRYII